MSPDIDRREFLKQAPAAAALVAGVAHVSLSAQGAPAVASAATHALEPFDYLNVRLLPSRWQQQVEVARTFFHEHVSIDDVLQGFRAAASMPAPGKPLGGWCGKDSNNVFGQWLSSLTRLARTTGDDSLRTMALTLYTEWVKTIGADGNARMDHYPFDKLVCGLVDLARYANLPDAAKTLARVTAYAAKTFQRAQAPLADITDNQAYYGRPQEWYTLAENQFRAYQLTGDAMFKRFGDEWLYHAYWNKFAKTSAPTDAHGVHAYSHVNTFSSAAMAYDVTGDQQYLSIIKNAYDYLQQFQCYATGGYGPNERFTKTDGSLGRALDTRSDTFEAVCGSWAGLKLSRYLMQFTGDARYGDWIERLFYNGIGAALPLQAQVRNFYYADYRVGGGMKVYNWDTCTCCSGTFGQNVAEYANLIYFKGGNREGLYVNLFVPSEVTWVGTIGASSQVQSVRVTQDTTYPDGDTTKLTLSMTTPVPLPLHIRVPSWATSMTFKVNGAPVVVEAKPDTWATLSRTWQTGDVVEIQLPLTLRMEPVDRQHPNRVAVMRGPVVFVLEGAYHDPNFSLPKTNAELAQWLVPEAGSLPRGVWATAPPPTVYPASLRVVPPDKRPVRLRFRPFYEIGENYPYFMYFDRDTLPWRLW
ncbi:MAG TPA: beta-L-arabinofuranosidase domain-containing protein [Vicinamibacterales bacterium]|nr:beta-L-arabinofuranosidase domain-containing protein [Vicinamibacterales bacterium]